MRSLCRTACLLGDPVSLLALLKFLLKDCLPLLEVTTVVNLDNSAFALAEWAIEVGNLKKRTERQ